MSRNFVYPGYVTSKNDGDIHFIGFGQLCRLFLLRPRDCIDMSDPKNRHGHGDIYGPDDKHYYPLYGGNYPIFDKRD